MTRQNTSESDNTQRPPIPQYDTVDDIDELTDAMDKEDHHHHHHHHEHHHQHQGIAQYDTVEEVETLETVHHRTSLNQEVPTPQRRSHPQYDNLDDIDDQEYITEVEVKSNRGSTLTTRPHVTIKQDEIEDIGERQVTVIEIASQKGSTKRVAPRKDYAPSIPLPEHPAQQSAPPTQQSRPQTTSHKPPNPEMEFDIGVKNIAPVLIHKMNMDDRDPKDSAQYLNTSFFEVFNEPSEQYHSIACVWTLSFKIFEIVRIYSYKILTLIFGLIIAFLGGILFALFAFLNIWIFRPILILTRMAFAQIVLIWPMFLIYIVRPFFYSVGAIFSTARLHTSRGEQVVEVWEKHIHHV
ncbi:Caveolin-2 [Caenorhabditis elegans]|uniref:Caveolin-2 n=3 Tax=Caenorhabditis elegans TaxID=6239 RepID=CAV2_CAEEL|nr:Caveolin-2 [Caenorhabditis elegans]Q18879.3 RecName: Full=Caveolin-2 [Caenorhabditis elegans]CAB01139.1 Caveolin-2 [Caenorhabditis elegans]|eukprot:NP_001256523.1 Caveolin-2 [Caenorhabditis elegans]